MIFLIRLIQNAVNIYSFILLAFALLSWFPNAYDSSLGRLISSLVRPVIQFIGTILTRLVLFL